MSVDTYILIKQTDKCYTVCIKPITGRNSYAQRSFKTLEEAVKYAVRLEDEEYIEYGIRFLLKENEK